MNSSPRVLLLFSMLIAASIAAPSHAAAAPAAPGQAIGVGIPFDYKIPDLDGLGGRVGYVWGASVARLPGIETDRYMPFSRDYLNADQGHPLSWWKRHHPSWIVYRCDRRTPAYMMGGTNVPLDLSNPAVRRYQFRAAASFLQEGFGGVAFDNVDIVNYEHRCGVWRGGRWHSLRYGQENRPDRRFTRSVVSWARDIRRRIKHSFPAARISANMTVESWRPMEAGFRLARYFDFVLDEQGVTRNARGRLTGDGWLSKMRFLQRLTATGRHFMLLNVTPAADDASVSADALSWSLASYLMVAETGDYVYVSSRSGYGLFYDRPEYRVPLGDPLGAFYDDRGVWRRDFSEGIVLANNSDDARTLSLPALFRDSSGELVNEVALQPGMGMMLLKTGIAQRAYYPTSTSAERPAASALR